MATKAKTSTAKVKSPTRSGNGFLWAVVAVIVIAAVVIGFFVWNASQKKTAEEFAQDTVNANLTVDDDGVTLASDSVTDSTPKVEIFEDFSCHYCSDLNNADHEQLLDAINNGELVVTFRPLNFLNEGFKGGSNRGAATALAVADTGDAEAYWNVRSYLLQNYADISGQWDAAQYADAVSNFNVEDAALDAIRSGNEDDAIAMAERNADELKSRIGSVSSPHVFINGEEYELNNEESFANWVGDAVSKS